MGGGGLVGVPASGGGGGGCEVAAQHKVRAASSPSAAAACPPLPPRGLSARRRAPPLHLRVARNPSYLLAHRSRCIQAAWLGARAITTTSDHSLSHPLRVEPGRRQGPGSRDDVWRLVLRREVRRLPQVEALGRAHIAAASRGPGNAALAAGRNGNARCCRPATRRRGHALLPQHRLHIGDASGVRRRGEETERMRRQGIPFVRPPPPPCRRRRRRRCVVLCVRVCVFAVACV